MVRLPKCFSVPFAIILHVRDALGSSDGASGRVIYRLNVKRQRRSFAHVEQI
jgi:hypothetical protein